MQALEKLIRKITKEAIKSPKDVSDVIPSETLDFLTQDESSFEKRLFNHFISDQVSVFNKLYAFSKLPIHEGAHFSEFTEYLDQTKDFIESKTGGRFDLVVDKKLQEKGFKLTAEDRLLIHTKFQDCVLAKINDAPLPFEPEYFTKIKELLSQFMDKQTILKTAKLVAQDIDQLPQAKNITIHMGRQKIPFEMNEKLFQVIREEHALHDPFIEFIQNLTGYDESTTRKEYAVILKELALNVSRILSIQKNSINQVYEILFDYTKNAKPSGNKQKVFDLIHAVLQPFYSSLHSKKEFDSLRKHTTHDSKTYRQHKRDAIIALMR